MPISKKTIQKSIYEIESPFPKDNMISSYKDFLKYRDFLHLFQFNPAVFESLIDMTLDLWSSKQRVSRFSLYQTIRRYGFQSDYENPYVPAEPKFENLSTGIKQKLFKLFQNAFSSNGNISNRQLQAIQRQANTLIIGLSFGVKEEQWLLNNIKHDAVLNRVLRYPKKSELISDWAYKVYENDYFRTRRSELTAKLLDQDEGFRIPTDVFHADGEYMLRLDQEIVQDYELTQYFFREKLKDEFRGLAEFSDPDDWDEKAFKLDLPARVYKRVIDYDKNKQYGIYNFPDLKATVKQFQRQEESLRKISMLWAIGYSNLSAAKKARLMKEHFELDASLTLVNICKKFGLAEPLKWLLNKRS